MAESVKITIDPIFGNIQKVEQQSAKAGQKAGENFSKGFRRRTSQALSALTSKVALFGTALAGAFAVRGIAKAGAEIQKLETGFITLLGSTRAASATIKDLQKFAATTPFELTGIADAASQLLAFGFSADSLTDRLQNIGDVAAGSNSRLEEVALIYGQVAAAGKLTGERLLQFQERAIPVGPAIAKTLGIAENQVREFVSAGKVGFAEFEQAFQSLSQEGGLFSGAIQRQSQTINGAVSNLGDSFFNLQAELGRTFAPAIIESAKALSGALETFARFVVANGPQITSTLSSIADTLLVTPTKFWARFFGSSEASDTTAKLNDRLEVLNKKLAAARERLSRTEGTFLGDLLGGTAQAKRDILALQAEIAILNRKISENTKENKQNQTTLQQSIDSRRELNKTIADGISKRAQEIQQESELAKKKLGTIGLNKEEILRKNAERDNQILREGLEKGAIDEQEFRERKLVRDQQLNEQLAQLREQDRQRKEAERNADIEAELAAEDTLSDILGNTSKRFKEVAKDFRVTSKDIAKSLVQGIGRGAGNAFAAFGQAVATGQDALSAFGKALLATFGQTLVQLGTGFILQGVAQSLAGFGNGAPLIAAGAALAAFGGLLSGLAGGGAPTTGASGGGGPVGGGNDSIATQQQDQEPTTQVAVNIQGDVLDSDETGLRIVELIKSAVQDQDAIVVTQAV